MSRLPALWLVVSALVLSACGGGGGGGTSVSTPGAAPPPPGPPVAAESFNATLVSPAMREDGSGPVTVTFSVFLPAHNEGERFPLVVHSHGYGGSRVGLDEADSDPDTPADAESTASVFSRIDNQVRLLWDDGYAVISFDQRGFGRGDDGDNGNSGAIQVMDPAFEIQDAIAVLDWAEANIPQLARDTNNDIIAGAIGGSYGGGYQLLLAALDARVDAIVPTATWYDLLQSLLPNAVIKKAYATGLCALGTSDSAEEGRRTMNACMQASDRGNPAARYREDIPENLPQAGNREELIAAFFTHGLVEFERRHNDDSDSFRMRPVDALLIQGNRDILFNLTETEGNYSFLDGLGGDVRVLSMENGHSIMQTRMNPGSPGSQGPLGPSTCGPMDALAATRAWLDLKLRGNTAAEADLPTEVCLSLDDRSGVALNALPLGSEARFDAFAVNIPAVVTDPPVMVTATSSNVSPSAGGIFVALSSSISASNQVLAGVPVARLTITDANPLAQANGGSTLFVGTAINRGGEIILVDDQVQPIRSSDPRAGATPQDIPLVGVAEQLQVGDVPGVLLYGNFDIYEPGLGAPPTNFAASNQVTVNGTVRLPIQTATAQTRPMP